MYNRTVRYDKYVFSLDLSPIQNRRVDEEDKQKFILKFHYYDILKNLKKSSRIVSLLLSVIGVLFYFKDFPVKNGTDLLIAIVLVPIFVVVLTFVLEIVIRFIVSIIISIVKKKHMKEIVDKFNDKKFDVYIPKTISNHIEQISSKNLYTYFVNSVNIAEKENKLKELEAVLKEADEMAEDDNDLALREDLTKKIEITSSKITELQQSNEQMMNDEFTKIEETINEQVSAQKEVKDLKKKKVLEEKIVKVLSE